ncbi:MAG: metallophosphoesterase family protein [Patescibacteria group bacterium]|jgi:hypothetical protein
MKIAIISDIHDNLVNLEKCLEWCTENKIEKIICCGDITNSETLSVLARYKCVFLVYGNMEIYDEDELVAYPNIINGGRTAIFNIAGKNIGACHEPFLIKEVFNIKFPLERGVAQYSETGCVNPDIIFYGHTHKPWIEEKNGVKLVNPGTLGGVFSRATFAVYDTEKPEPELKILDLL